MYCLYQCIQPLKLIGRESGQRLIRFGWCAMSGLNGMMTANYAATTSAHVVLLTVYAGVFGRWEKEDLGGGEGRGERHSQSITHARRIVEQFN